MPEVKLHLISDETLHRMRKLCSLPRKLDEVQMGLQKLFEAGEEYDR